MTSLQLVRPVAAALGAAFVATAGAQTAPGASVPSPGAPVVTDAAPPPAEDRSSTGAIVLENAPVRAQRDAARSMGNTGTATRPAPKASQPGQGRRVQGN